VPFYLDVGTGQSQLTWQISGGIGYSFTWGSVFATWRYLDYKFQSGKPLDSTNMSGPCWGSVPMVSVAAPGPSSLRKPA
jgi:hypothetical protein